MGVELSQQASGARVALSGAVGLQEIQQLRSALEAAMRNPAGIWLELEELCGIDVSVLQLIHATMCSRREGLGTAVRVSGLSQEVVQQAADLGGGGVGCGRVCGAKCCVFEACGTIREEH